MGLVTEVDDAAAPTVLIVDNNPMSSLRLSNLFKTRNFNVELSHDDLELAKLKLKDSMNFYATLIS